MIVYLKVVMSMQTLSPEELLLSASLILEEFIVIYLQK